MRGIITKAISGFYYVLCDGDLYECKARGNFRHKAEQPLCGDIAEFNADASGGVITSIVDRRNSLIRPPVANVDKLFIVQSVADPSPNLLLIDRLTVIAETKGIEPILIFNKSDIADAERYAEIYTECGFKAFAFSCKGGDDPTEIRKLTEDGLCVFTGNSGVGKSSILNAVFPNLALKTGETSRKLGRGKHTTRHIELYGTGSGYVADTPGFSSLDIERYEPILKDELPRSFREFAPFIDNCRFTSCSHTSEKGCAVLDAVKDGKIPQSRHNSYVSMYNEIKDIKEWEIKKNNR